MCGFEQVWCGQRERKMQTGTRMRCLRTISSGERQEQKRLWFANSKACGPEKMFASGTPHQYYLPWYFSPLLISSILGIQYSLVLPRLSLGTPLACPSCQLPISHTFLGSLLTRIYIMWLNDVSSLVPFGDLLCYSTSSLVIKSSLNPHFTGELSLQWAKLWWWGLTHPE